MVILLAAATEDIKAGDHVVILVEDGGGLTTCRRVRDEDREAMKWREYRIIGPMEPGTSRPL
jgi:hypothetical protein